MLLVIRFAFLVVGEMEGGWFDVGLVCVARSCGRGG
jgi:hypothetical protein